MTSHLPKLMSELHMVVCTSLGLHHPLAKQLRDALESGDERRMEAARDAWLEQGPPACEKLMEQAAEQHRDRIVYAFALSQHAAKGLLALVNHPAFKQLRGAASFAASLTRTSRLLDLAEANRRFSEALSAFEAAQRAGELDARLQFRQPEHVPPPVSH